ncbi:MAG: hypothetical protein CVT66_07355 [Actinobacteria bacterium HGW-Actinobacteria-6]|nr:MAG: hypothetical protein CVT66_07355 [Actinobacteria bacterium HGW-Actinobacteria-6]
MSEEFVVPGTEQPPVVAAEVSSAKKTNKGLLVALGAVAVLAIIAAIVVLLVLPLFTVVDEVEVRVPEQGAPQNPVVTSEEIESTEAADRVTNDEVFTFRDIFKPLLGAVTVGTTTATESTTETVEISEYAAGTLYLTAVGSENGEQFASFVWNGEDYVLGEGDIIDGTPWKVLDIRTSDVVMLYGDQQVVLSVGQGISK